jgi:hypothetical protein
MKTWDISNPKLMPSATPGYCSMWHCMRGFTTVHVSCMPLLIVKMVLCTRQSHFVLVLSLENSVSELLCCLDVYELMLATQSLSYYVAWMCMS